MELFSGRSNLLCKVQKKLLQFSLHITSMCFSHIFHYFLKIKYAKRSHTALLCPKSDTSSKNALCLPLKSSPSTMPAHFLCKKGINSSVFLVVCPI